MRNVGTDAEREEVSASDESEIADWGFIWEPREAKNKS